MVCDVGAHKVWTARLYQAFEPNTVIISNGLAAMGIGVPGAIAASLAPERRVVALTGDGGFLMNSQELETAQRIGVRMTVVVWRDDGYGLIDWKQGDEFGRPFGVEFGNPDLVKYAESFGIAGFRPESAADLLPTLKRALEVDGVSRGRAHRLCRERPPVRASGQLHGVVAHRRPRGVVRIGDAAVAGARPNTRGFTRAGVRSIVSETPDPATSSSAFTGILVRRASSVEDMSPTLRSPRWRTWVRVVDRRSGMPMHRWPRRTQAGRVVAEPAALDDGEARGDRRPVLSARRS